MASNDSIFVFSFNRRRTTSLLSSTTRHKIRPSHIPAVRSSGQKRIKKKLLPFGREKGLLKPGVDYKRWWCDVVCVEVQPAGLKSCLAGASLPLSPEQRHSCRQASTLGTVGSLRTTQNCTDLLHPPSIPFPDWLRNYDRPGTTTHT